MQVTMARAAAASAIALLLGAGAFAQDPSGFVGAGVSHNEVDNGVDEEFAGYVLEAGYFNEFGTGFGFQANADLTYFDTEPDEVDGWTGEAQLFNRNSMRSFGAFGSYSDSDSSDGLWGFGGDGEIYNGSWTVGGVAGWFDGDSLDAIYGGCAFVRVYGTENFSLEGRGSLVNVDYGPMDTDGYGLGVGAEYQVMGTPFSLIGDIDRTDLDDANLEVTSFMLRGRVNLGTNNLIDRDRGGAGMPGGRCILGTAS